MKGRNWIARWYSAFGAFLLLAAAAVASADVTIRIDSEGPAIAGEIQGVPDQWTLILTPVNGSTVGSNQYVKVDSQGRFDWTPPAGSGFGDDTVVRAYSAYLGEFDSEEFNYRTGTEAEPEPEPEADLHVLRPRSCTQQSGSLTRFSMRDVTGNAVHCLPGNGAQLRSHLGSSWRGEGVVGVGNTIGEEFSIDWNTTNDFDQWGEFDFSVSRDFYVSGSEGYGEETLGSMGNQTLRMTSRGTWGGTQSGLAHNQVIVWLSNNRSPRLTIDVTIVEWMTPELRDNYIAYALGDGRLAGNGRPGIKNDGPPDAPAPGRHLPRKTQYIGDHIAHDGMKYWMFQREPGDLEEKASFLLIRDVNRNYLFASDTSDVRANEFLTSAREKGIGENGRPLFDQSWKIEQLGWEITGKANEHHSDYDDIGDPNYAANHIENSTGKFSYSCYSIPSLIDASRSGTGFDAC